MKAMHSDRDTSVLSTEAVSNHSAQNSSESASLQTYEAPRLIALGTLLDMTRGGARRGVEAQGGPTS